MKYTFIVFGMITESPLLMLFLSVRICVIVWGHLLSAWKIPFNMSFKADLLAKKKKSLFIFIWGCFILPSSLKNSFAGYESWLTIFILSTSTNCLLTSIVSIEMSALNLTGVLLYVVKSFFSFYFQDFSLCLYISAFL